MVHPERIPGEHTIFVAGDDADAKATASQILTSFGWPETSVIDLGGIAGARGSEMYMRLYFQLATQFGFDVTIQVKNADTAES
jgi:predicted dinucleotide-binding enzyme